ncbi:protein of unknown function [Agreia sp. COWG]|nr:protein of unknown function [Agreia sp. COWG]
MDAFACKGSRKGVELGLVAGDESDIEALLPEGPRDLQTESRASADDGDKGHDLFLRGPPPSRVCSSAVS